jgi:hypothetical protein
MIGAGIGSSSSDTTGDTASAAGSSTPATTVTLPGATATVPGPTVTVTTSSVKTVTSAPKVDVAMEGDGTYEVGVDVKPGTYVSSKPELNCYWARLKGSGGGFGDIIANNNTSGRSVVTIKKTDKFFETSGCEPLDQALRPVASAAPVGHSAVPDVEQEHEMSRFVDLVENAPVAGQPRAVDPGQLFAKRLPHAPWVLEKGADDELSRRCGNRRRKRMRQSPAGRRSS